MNKITNNPEARIDTLSYPGGAEDLYENAGFGDEDDEELSVFDDDTQNQES